MLPLGLAQPRSLGRDANEPTHEPTYILNKGQFMDLHIIARLVVS